jgi:hypothetical protein
MRDSGADPEYNKSEGNTRWQIDYLRKNSGPGGKYTRVLDFRNLQPGDIAIRHNAETGAGHTFFYVGEQPGFGGKSASASMCDRAPMAGPTDSPGKYEWYRLN